MNKHSCRRKAVCVVFLMLAVLMPVLSGCGLYDPADTLHGAASDGDILRIRQLLRKHHDINEVDYDGMTPLESAVYRGRGITARYLMYKGAEPNLFVAAGLGDIGLAKKLLDEDGGVEEQHRSGGTPMHWAARNGHKRMVEWLIKKGAGVDTRDVVTGKTSLHVAAAYDHSRVVSALIENGADVNAQYAGTTPLNEAVRTRAGIRVIKSLIAAGTDVNLRDRDGETALHHAYNHFKPCTTSRLLMAAGADVNAKDRFGYSPLYRAVRSGNEALSELMLSEGGETDLFVASGIGDAKLVRRSIEQGADVNAVDGLSYTPLHWAAENGRLSTAEILVKNGADVNASNKAHFTPLHVAVRGPRGRPSTSGDIWFFRKRSFKGNIDVATFLVLKGANPCVKDDYDLTPLVLAEWGGYSSLATLMREHSGKSAPSSPSDDACRSDD